MAVLALACEHECADGLEQMLLVVMTEFNMYFARDTFQSIIFNRKEKQKQLEETFSHQLMTRKCYRYVVQF